MGQLICFAVVFICSAYYQEGVWGKTINVVSYLSRFGYLPPEYKNSETANLITDESLKSALEDFQSFHGLNASGVADDATLKLMNTPRCRMPDKIWSDNHALGSEGSKWHKTELSYHITKRSDKLDRYDVEAVIADVLRIWSSQSPLKFRNTDDRNPDIEIRFEKGQHNDNYPFDGPGDELAHSFYPGYNLGGDVHFDDSEYWAAEIPRVQPSRAIVLSVVAIHELGHALGLVHSYVKSAMMYAFYTAPRQPLVLHQVDINQLEKFYGPKYNTKLANNRNSYCTMNLTDYTVFTDYDSRTYFLWGPYYWEIRESGVSNPWPQLIRDKWQGLNGPVDAAAFYKGFTYFFQGAYVTKFSKGFLQLGYPTTIRNEFRVSVPDYVDAVLPYGGYLWVFKAHQVWRYPPPYSNNYPKIVEQEWGSDVPRFMDAALSYTNGDIYFFIGNSYFRYNEQYRNVDNDDNFPRKVTEWWLFCEHNKRPYGRL